MPFTKGHKLSKGRPEGAKNKTTILKEERRAIFEQRVSEKFLETIDKARPEYLLDQFLGKAPDKLDVTTKGESLNDTTRLDELVAKLEAQLDEPEGTTISP